MMLIDIEIKEIFSFLVLQKYDDVIYSINLSHNKIHATGIQYLSDSIKDSFPHLSELDLSYNEIEDKGIKYLNSALKERMKKRMQTLEFLNMDCISVFSVYISSNKYIK